MASQYQQQQPGSLSPNGYPLYELSPRQFGAGNPTVPVSANASSTAPCPQRPSSSYQPHSPSLDDNISNSKNGQHISFGSFPSDLTHAPVGGGSNMDGWGATVDAPFGGLDGGPSMTAFGSLPTFDQTAILAHRSSFDPPSSASSFGSERPGTAGGASALISMSRSGGTFGASATYGLVDDSLGAQANMFNNQMGQQMFAGGQNGVFVGGADSSTRSSPYGGDPSTHSPSSAGSAQQARGQFAYAPQSQQQQQRFPPYLQHFNPNRYPTPPTGLSPTTLTQPSRSPGEGPPMLTIPTEHLPLFLEQQHQQQAMPLPNSSPFHRRASEGHLAQQPFHPAHPTAAFQSPSNTPPGAPSSAGHLYQTPSTSSFPGSHPNSARASSSRRPSSSSSAARRPTGSSHHPHPFDPSTSSLQNFGHVGRPQQQSAQSQRMHAHPYAHPSAGGSRRRDSMGMPSSATTSAFAWDVSQVGPYGSAGGASMRPQTSDGIPGSALHGFGDFPASIFYQSSNQPSSNPNHFISPSNLTGAPFGAYGDTFQTSSLGGGSEFPLQQPIFASAGPSGSSLSGTPSTVYHASGGTPSQSRPSTAPSLGMSSTSSVNPRQLLPASATAPSIKSQSSSSATSRPPAPAPAYQQLLTSTPQDGKSKAKSLVRDAKKDNISPVTGRPKRPRRKHEEVERLYECLAAGCGKSYGTLNHLNQHILTQNHGEKRTPAEFRDLRRAWRRKRKEQNAAAAAAQKANGGGSVEVKFGGLEKRPSNATSASSNGRTPAGGRRRSSASGMGVDDSEEEDEDEDDEESNDGSSSTNPPSSVPHQHPSVLIPSVFSSYPPGSSSTQHTPTFAYDPSQISSHHHPTSNGHPHPSAGPLSPLDPLLPFFSGGPPSSTTFSPAPTFSTNNANTPDFNQWAFSDPTSTPSYRGGGGGASGLVHHTGFSPLAGLGVEPPSSLDHQPMSGLGRRSSRRRGSGVGTIEEVGEA